MHYTLTNFYLLVVVLNVNYVNEVSIKNGAEWSIVASFLNVVFGLTYLFANVALFMVFMLPLVIAWIRNANTPSYLASISEVTA